MVQGMGMVGGVVSMARTGGKVEAVCVACE